MEREKQIEEMAKVICAPTANKGNCEKCGFKKHCSKFDDATDLYNAGYRKADDVAEEIFEEIDKQIAFFRMYMFLNNGVKAIVNTLDEIKKKYNKD